MRIRFNNRICDKVNLYDSEFENWGIFANFALMKTSKIIGFIILGLLWVWLAFAVLKNNFTLMSLLTVLMSGAIIFIPLWKKYGRGQ